MPKSKKTKEPLKRERQREKKSLVSIYDPVLHPSQVFWSVIQFFSSIYDLKA
jgi:hypothetical protein